MQYMGSKRRIAKTLLPIITRGRTDFNWVEPFAGGMNMIDKVETSGFRVANDYNKYVVALFDAVVNHGWVPKDHYTREDYDRLKTLDGPDHEIGYVAFCCSFGGKWFNGYVENVYVNPTTRKTVYRHGTTKRSLLKQVKSLNGVSFTAGSYDEIHIQDGDIVYCDPPYAGTTKYKDDFDSVKFWQWVRDTSEYAEVYVSEYSAPDDMVVIWEKVVNTNVAASTNADTRTERLFTYL